MLTASAKGFIRSLAFLEDYIARTFIIKDFISFLLQISMANGTGACIIYGIGRRTIHQSWLSSYTRVPTVYPLPTSLSVQQKVVNARVLRKKPPKVSTLHKCALWPKPGWEK